ncbi:MAG: hypothetical protein EOP45_02980 [Sphingobacteriaceae bacterium]|nr:MAG: hypothetical protein EOP45_02980 [Sphingobacteriaceae bacterium]
MYSLKISKNLYFYYIKSKGLSCLITQPHFWDGYAGNYTKTLNESGINISTAAVRAMLKVSFYTSLNGGNPFNAERMSANLKINAPDLIIPYNSISEFERSNTYSTVRKVCSNLEIISDVQRLKTK